MKDSSEDALPTKKETLYYTIQELVALLKLLTYAKCSLRACAVNVRIQQDDACDMSDDRMSQLQMRPKKM